MHWIYLLGVVTVLVLLAALTGAKPEDGRPVAGTRLMTVGRIALGLLAVLLLFLAVHAWLGT